MYDEKNESMVISREKKGKKANKISSVWIRLFDKYFILKFIE